ncbi:MAG: hypothetical protein AAF602_29930 [Myxococcota bacterium]
MSADAPRWVARAADAILQPMGGRAWAVPPAKPPRHTPPDAITVARLQEAAAVDLRLLVWIVLHASPRLRATDAVPEAVAEWCLDDGALDQDGFSRVFDALDLASVVPRHGIRYPAVRRQIRPLQATSHTLSRWLTQRPALAVAWDATVDRHTRSPDASFGAIQMAIRRLPRLVHWLRAREPDAGWTVTSAWRDPVGRLLVERSTLGALD